MSEKNQKRILILDGETRSALAVVRSLGKNHNCFVCSHQRNAISFASCYTQANLISPILSKDDPKSISWLQDTIKKLKIDYIIPTTEKTLFCIYSSKELTKILHNLPFPSSDSFHKLTDKLDLGNLLSDFNIDYPKTLLIKENSKDYIENILLKEISYPLIIKARRSVALDLSSGLELDDKPPVYYIKNKEDLDQLYLNKFFINKLEFIAQEYIEGPGVGVFFLIKDSKVYTSFSHHRLLEKPPQGGVSVLSQSIYQDVKILEKFSSFLISLKWEGVAMIECKKTENKLSVIEINPRFWGSLQLAIDSGADFPKDLICLEEKIHTWNSFKENQTLRWELGSLDHFFIKLKKNPIDSIIKIIFYNALKFSVKNKLEILRFNDIKPFFEELKNYFRIS